MEAEGKTGTVFFDGSVTTAEEFETLMRQTMSLGVWDIAAEKWVFAGWASLGANAWADMHFVCLGRPKYAPALLVMEIFERAGVAGLMGHIPEPNALAQKYVTRLGWKRAGTIPKFFRLTDGRRVGAVIFHHRLGKG